MNEPHADSGNERRTGRVLPPAPGDVRPAYSAARVLAPGALEAETLLEEARRTRDEAEEAARTLLEGARVEARELLEAARREAASLTEAARDEGRARALAEVRGLLAALGEELERLRASYPMDVQRIAFRYARKVLDVELAVRPERVVDLCARVLERARHHERLALRVHPDDAPLVREALADLRRQLLFAGELTVVEDEELARHGVCLETDMGSYLGSVEEQLRPLREALGLAEWTDLPASDAEGPA